MDAGGIEEKRAAYTFCNNQFAGRARRWTSLELTPINSAAAVVVIVAIDTYMRLGDDIRQHPGTLEGMPDGYQPYLASSSGIASSLPTCR